MNKDIYKLRSASPMLLTESEPFDSKEHIYELKLDGIRCLAYLESGKTELRNKRNKILNDTYPELKELYNRINNRCILDGELIVLSDGKPDFYQVQKRSLMTDKFKIELLSKNNPVRFVAYDILYIEDNEILYKPLFERKELLQNIVCENEFISISRFIHDKGIDYYNIVANQDLEGVVAKQKNSIYQMGKRSKNWVKFKKMYDEDFIICGYVPNTNCNIKSIVLCAYKNNNLIYQGHVALGISKEAAEIIIKYATLNKQKCIFKVKEIDDNILWFKPELVCTVQYMMRTDSGYLRQPVFKGLRFDKESKECIVN